MEYLDEHGKPHHVRADIVIMAASAIETARLALLSTNPKHPRGLGNRSDQLGRNLLFHLFTLGIGLFSDEAHASRGPSSTFVVDDFVGPDRSAAVRATGLPYRKGGILEFGGGVSLLDEAGLYTLFPGVWGRELKDLLRASPLRAHLGVRRATGRGIYPLRSCASCCWTAPTIESGTSAVSSRAAEIAPGARSRMSATTSPHCVAARPHRRPSPTMR